MARLSLFRGNRVVVPPLVVALDESGTRNDPAQDPPIPDLLRGHPSGLHELVLAPRLGERREVVEAGAHVDLGARLVEQRHVEREPEVVHGPLRGIGDIRLARRADYARPEDPLNAARARRVPAPDPPARPRLAQRGRRARELLGRRLAQEGAIERTVDVGVHEVVGGRITQVDRDAREPGHVDVLGVRENDAQRLFRSDLRRERRRRQHEPQRCEPACSGHRSADRSGAHTYCAPGASGGSSSSTFTGTPVVCSSTDASVTASVAPGTRICRTSVRNAGETVTRFLCSGSSGSRVSPMWPGIFTDIQRVGDVGSGSTIVYARVPNGICGSRIAIFARPISTPLRYTMMRRSAALTRIVTGPSGDFSGCQRVSSSGPRRGSPAGAPVLTSTGASTAGCTIDSGALCSDATTTVMPIGDTWNSRFANSDGRWMQPCEDG